MPRFSTFQIWGFQNLAKKNLPILEKPQEKTPSVMIYRYIKIFLQGGWGWCIQTPYIYR